ncbi:hypothetical protein B0T25DRAFT_1945 [Lasiosphaeria hispida]|uniref:Uncharacterized protein n=1 Tax=Lasiosphaeria hispida TaxID=260671 RepID=A0AAJ0HSW3_9PEZI|nr:hypothetical protein B0T25DRAFT_1945 [Lasiosphaeria hispida]
MSVHGLIHELPALLLPGILYSRHKAPELNISPQSMSSYITVQQAYLQYGPVDREALQKRLSRKQRGILRFGLVRSNLWRQLPTEGIYQVAILEDLDTGIYALPRGGGRAFAVTAVLDLGLRMLESPRGRLALENIACQNLRLWGLDAANLAVQGTSLKHEEQQDLPTAVSNFLRCVRARFPIVRLDKRSGFHEDTKLSCTATHDHHWQHWQEKGRLPTCPGDDTTLQFNPKEAAVLHLNWQLVDKLYWTRLKADEAQRRHHGEDTTDQTARFRRLQFHLATVVAHHICHLFIGYLREFVIDGLGHNVDSADILRAVRRYDAGAEFEVEFFGGRPKMFIDFDGPAGERYAGRSFMVRRGGNKRRVATAISGDGIERYLRGDFSLPLLSEEDCSIFPSELYRDVKRRHELSPKKPKKDETGAEFAEQTPLPEEQPLAVPWSIRGQEYQMLKRACYDPSIRLVDANGF